MIVKILMVCALVMVHDLDQRCTAADKRRGLGKGPECFELFRTVTEIGHSQYSGVEG